MAAGRVSTQATAMFRILESYRPEPFAAMVPKPSAMAMLTLTQRGMNFVASSSCSFSDLSLARVSESVVSAIGEVGSEQKLSARHCERIAVSKRSGHVA